MSLALPGSSKIRNHFYRSHDQVVDFVFGLQMNVIQFILIVLMNAEIEIKNE